MRLIPTNKTLQIDYVLNESLTLSKNKIEGQNRLKFYFWLITALIASFAVFSDFLFAFVSASYFDMVLIISIGVLILSIIQFMRYMPQTKYFFDKVSFQPNQIELTKNKETHTLDFKPPYSIDLVIDQSEKRTRIDLEYFGERLLTFQIEKIEDLPKLTDGLCDLYNLDLVDFFEFDGKVQMLDFYSKEDKSVTTFININDDEMILKINLPLDDTTLQFDWFKNVLTVENEMVVEILAIDEIDNITWYFETKDANRTCLIYILDQQKEFIFELPILSKKSDESTFQTALQFIKILKSKVVLEDRDIEINSQYLD